MVRSTMASSYAFRSLCTPSVAPIQKPIEQMPAAVELDKLYKRVELEMRGIDPAVLLSYSWFCVAAASHLGIEVTKRYVLKLFIGNSVYRTYVPGTIYYGFVDVI